jgi:hypothetical protein
MLVAFMCAAVPAGIAVAESDGLKVTGGGQVVADDQASGPGDTIAFNAQQTAPADAMSGIAAAKGQLQVINRTGGTKFHGDVTCIRTITVDDAMDPNNGETFVRFGGFQQVRGQNTTTPFTVDVQDNGEGSTASEDDMIYFRQRDPGEDPCEDDSNPATELRSSTLARGNVKQH